MGSGEQESGRFGGLRGRLGHRIGTLRSIEWAWARGTLELLYVLVILAAVDLSMDGRLSTLEWLGVDATITTGDLLVTIPPGIYLYAVLGAGVYVATSLVFEPKDSLGESKRLGYRLLAALPLGAGVFLFATVLMGGEVLTVPIGGENGATVTLDANASAAGLAFLGGLFIRLTLKKLGDIAETISNVGQVGELQHRTMQQELEASEAVRDAWRELAQADGGARARDPDAYESLRRAETLLESSDATVSQLERAVDLAEAARAGFGGRSDV